jgi:hypothetical protein
MSNHTFILLQMKNKPRDGDSEHAFILGLMDCTSTVANKYCRVPRISIVSEHMGWVRNVVLMSVYFGSGEPQGVGISGGGARWADEGNAGVSLRATQGRGGRILSQQGGFQVSGKGNKGSKGSQGIIVYITHLSYVYKGMNAAVNDTSCIFA